MEDARILDDIFYV